MIFKEFNGNLEFHLKSKLSFLAIKSQSLIMCFNLDLFLEGIRDYKIKDELKKVTQEAHDKEIFGAPTFAINNKIFWGQDRLEFALDEYNK